MPTRFVPVTDYSITHFSGLDSPARAEVSLYDSTTGVQLVGTLLFFDQGADPNAAKPTVDGPAAAYPLAALTGVVDTLRNERPIMACLDSDSGALLYVGTQLLEPAGEGRES